MKTVSHLGENIQGALGAWICTAAATVFGFVNLETVIDAVVVAAIGAVIGTVVGYLTKGLIKRIERWLRR